MGERESQGGEDVHVLCSLVLQEVDVAGGGEFLFKMKFVYKQGLSFERRGAERSSDRTIDRQIEAAICLSLSKLYSR